MRDVRLLLWMVNRMLMLNRTKKSLEVAVWLLIILATLYLARSRRINSEDQPEMPQTEKLQTAA
jgi:beta-lactamase regulating signal transducer with metallopeptidase domain